VAGVDPQAAALRLDLLDVEEAQPVRREDLLHGVEGQVGVMLVVDRVVVVSCIIRIRCGNSSVTTPVGPSRMRKPSTKSLTSGTCASTLLPSMRSGAKPSVFSAVAVSAPKKATRLGTPAAIAASATLPEGSMPRTETPRSWKYSAGSRRSRRPR